MLSMPPNVQTFHWPQNRSFPSVLVESQSMRNVLFLNLQLVRIPHNWSAWDEEKNGKQREQRTHVFIWYRSLMQGYGNINIRFSSSVGILKSPDVAYGRWHFIHLLHAEMKIVNVDDHKINLILFMLIHSTMLLRDSCNNTINHRYQ